MASKEDIRRVSIYINGDAADLTLKQLTAGTNKLNNELRNLTIGTDAYNAKMKELAAARAVLADVNNDINKISQAMEESKGFISDWKQGFSEIEEMAAHLTLGTLIYKGVSAGIEGIKELFTGSEQAYKEAVKTQVQLQQVLKTTGGIAGETSGKLEEYQKTLQAQTGVDDDVIAKGEEMLLTFTNIRGKIYDQTVPAIVDMTSAMNGGTVSMEGIQKTAIQVGKALQDPIAGTTSLGKAGVKFSDQQKEQIKTFVKSNDIMSAQAIILKELQKEFGGTAKAIADTQDVGKLQKFDTAWENLKEKIGSGIVETKANIAGFFQDIVEGLSKTGTAGQQAADTFNVANENYKTLSTTLQPLLDKYDELSSKTTLTKNEQAELKDVIKKISEVCPQAVTGVDDYGKAMAISTGLAKDFLKSQKDLLAYMNQDAIKKTTDDIDGYTAKLKHYNQELKEGWTEDKIAAFFGAKNRGLKLTDVMRADIVQKVNELGVLKKGAEEALDKLQGKEKPEEKVTPAQTGITAEELAAEQRKAEAALRKAEAEKKAQEEYLASSAALTEKLKQFNEDQLADTLSKNDKEVKALENKYDKEWTDATAALTKLRQNKNADQDTIKQQQYQIDALAGQKAQAVADLRARQEKELTTKIIAFRDQMSGRLETELQKEEQNINRTYDALLADGYNKDIVEKARAQDLADAKIAEEKRFQEEKDKISAEGIVTDAQKQDLKLAQINKKYDDEIVALKKKYSKELQATKEFQDAVAKININRAAEIEQSDADHDKERKDLALQSAGEISNAVFTISANNRQAETDAAIKSLEDQKTKELDNANLTADQKTAINDKYAKQEAEIKLKAWEADKDAQLKQAIINGALAVVKALPNFILAGAAGVAALAQIAIIEEQKPPQFADGGYSAVEHSNPAGWVKRPTLFTNSASGRPFIAGEGYKSEYIISSQQLRDPAIANFVGIMEANRGVRRFESGGFSYTETKTKPLNNGSPGNGSNSTDLAETNRLLAGLHDKFDSWGQKPWDFNMRQFKIAQDKIDAINNNSKA